jgi:hypothetical protein
VVEGGEAEKPNWWSEFWKKIDSFDSGKMQCPGWHGSYVRACVYRSGMGIYPQGILTEAVFFIHE